MKNYDESDRHSDTEITLGITSILGIFFALALICGVFFGFGYSVGRTHTPRAAHATQTASSQSANTAPSAIKTVVEPAGASQPKPAAGDPMPTPALTASTSAATAGQIAPAAYTATASATTAGLANAASTNGAATPVKPVSATYPPPASIMVQIAAVSRPEDASVLVSALKDLGYNASVHSEPTDKLLHVQIGPFASRNQAMAMRAKLINDGYNAILK